MQIRHQKIKRVTLKKKNKNKKSALRIGLVKVHFFIQTIKINLFIYILFL